MGNYEQFRDVHTLLEEQAKERPNKVYLESPDQGKNITFGQMAAWCHRMANFLAKKGITRDDKISMIAENSIETLMLYFGVLNYGAIINPINVEESQENVYRLLSISQPKIVFYGQELTFDQEKYKGSKWIPFTEFIGEGAPQNEFSTGLKRCSPVFEQAMLSKDGFSTITFTSGTTATPKAVVSSRESTYFMAVEAIDRLGITERDVMLDYRAYNWNSPQILSIGPCLITGTTLVYGRKFSRSRFASWLKDYKVTICIGVPTVINFLLEQEVPLHKKDVPALKFMTSSSAPLLVKNQLRFEERYGIPINQLAGSSEANLIACNEPFDVALLKQKIGSIGKAPKYKEVFVIDEQGERLPAGEEGEIIVRGKSMAVGYLWENGEITRFPEDGFHTGDLGHIDSDGYIYITGRKKNQIDRGGVKISPAEITNWLMEHPAVHQAETIGVPDKVYGEEVASFIIPKAGYQVTQQEIASHCQRKLPDFKLPKTICFLDQFPTGSTGKVTKAGLLKIWEEKYQKDTGDSVVSYKDGK